MQIHQLSLNYLPEQDRILLKVNTAASEEMRVWLTRRLMVGLWPLLNQMVTKQMLQLETAGPALESADDGLKKMLTDFRKEQFLREADFETPYEKKPAALPLGPKPLLVTDVDATPLSGGGLRLHFHERPKEPDQRNFRMQMEPRLVQGMMHLMEKALRRSQWSEPLAFAAAAADVAHADAAEGEQKPRYLN